ncbi:MAG: hypothetical protein K2X43_06845 [Hyphomonadaceae bacterium]|jgi:hypothetical protein|nr:hypothetical protein [Hyphomonadaceae bacterium]
MSGTFEAQALVQTRARRKQHRLEMTFVDADGRRQTISLPAAVAADLAQVLTSLSAGLSEPGKAQFTRMPRQMAVGSAKHERLVLIRFDDEPPYGLDPDEAETLWRGVREEAEQVARLKAPMRQ